MQSWDFYPRSPCGERHQWPDGSHQTAHFYPRSPCGERQTATRILMSNPHISIHALLAESDNRLKTPCVKLSIISIHALLAESDRRHRGNDRRPVNFYPRSPCGERHGYGQYYIRAREISIHALLAESDGCRFVFLTLTVRFLSTLSLRRATTSWFTRLA